MKCPKCGQEIIDNKDFCTNCGAQLKESKMSNNPKKYIIFVAIFIIFGIVLSYSIMNFGLDKELKPYLEDTNNDNDNSLVKKYYGKYYIKDIITNDNTIERITKFKNTIMEYTIDFSSSKLVVGLYDDNFLYIDNPDVYIKESTDVESLFDTNNGINNMLITGYNKDSNSLDKENINFITNGDTKYLYYGNALFELEEINNKDESNNETISSYYGNYKIKDIVINDNTPSEITDSKDNIVGWNVIFSADKVMVGVNKIYWLNVSNPDIYTKDPNEISSYFDEKDSPTLIYVVGENISGISRNPAIRFVINNDKLYMIYEDTLFELEKNNDSYNNSNTFYKVDLLDSTKYSKEINDIISKTNEDAISNIEGDLTVIVQSSYVIEKDDTINHIIITNIIGYPHSSYSTFMTCINYNTKTMKLYNLEEYLNYKNISFDSIKDKFNTALQEINKSSSYDFNTIKISKDSVYYFKNNKLYIKYGEIVFEGIQPLFLSVDL